MAKKYSFEEKIDEINHELKKRRAKWQLSAMSYMDYDDVCQIIRLHIYEKWHQWDQKRPLVNWVNRVITNRMINLVRDHYGNIAPPCKDCPFNLWGNHCEKTPSGFKCAECPLYAKWEKEKKDGYNLKLSSSIDSEDFVEQVSYSSNFDDCKDVEKMALLLHQKMKEILTDHQWKVYKAYFVDNLTNKELAKKFGEGILDNSSPVYKRVHNIKRKVVALSRAEVKKLDL